MCEINALIQPPFDPGECRGQNVLLDMVTENAWHRHHLNLPFVKQWDDIRTPDGILRLCLAVVLHTEKWIMTGTRSVPPVWSEMKDQMGQLLYGSECNRNSLRTNGEGELVRDLIL